MDTEETCASKNLNETVCQEKRRGNIRGEGKNSTSRLANPSAASFPGRNKCPRTHCRLVEQEEREDRE